MSANRLVRTNSEERLPGKRDDAYRGLVGGIAGLLDAARRRSARAVNELLTTTYWEIGRRIIEFEQQGDKRAAYGAELLGRLSRDLTRGSGRGFSRQNLQQMRLFYLQHPADAIRQTLSGKSSVVTLQASREEPPSVVPVTVRFPLAWSAYVRMLGVRNDLARRFYEKEALRGGWSVRQLDRQIDSQFYERTALSRSKAAMLKKGARGHAEDAVTAEDEVKDPYVLEFLGLQDEYSETDLEQALIRHLESFLLELGGEFCFVGRQKRLRIGDEWFRVDLVFYHRRLRCLVLTDLKLGRFTHADAGQMHTYLNYATEHWTHPGENPPVGLILCAQRDEALAHYALGNLPSKVMAAEYRTVLPDEKLLAADLGKARRMLERRGSGGPRHVARHGAGSTR